MDIYDAPYMKEKVAPGTLSLFSRLFYLAVEFEDDVDVTLAAAAAAAEWFVNPEWAASQE